MHSQAQAPIAADHEAATTQPGGLVASFFALPTPVRLVCLAAVGLAVLLMLGVPLSALFPFAAMGACLGMHLFMGHGSHGDRAGHGH